VEKSYFNSSLPVEIYKLLKIEAIQLNLTIKQHISNILENYVKLHLEGKKSNE